MYKVLIMWRNSYNFDKITSAPLFNGLLHVMVAGKGRVVGSFRKLHFRSNKVHFFCMKLSMYVQSVVD